MGVRRRPLLICHAGAASRWLVNVKKLGKRLGGERYLQYCRLILGDEPGVRWDDCRD